MNPTTIILFLVASGILSLTAYSAFGHRRHPVLAFIALSATLGGAIGAWYSWLECGSIPWTLAYGTICVGGVAGAIRQLHPSSTLAPAQEDL